MCSTDAIWLVQQLLCPVLLLVRCCVHLANAKPSVCKKVVFMILAWPKPPSQLHRTFSPTLHWRWGVSVERIAVIFTTCSSLSNWGIDGKWKDWVLANGRCHIQQCACSLQKALALKTALPKIFPKYTCMECPHWLSKLVIRPQCAEISVTFCHCPESCRGH